MEPATLARARLVEATTRLLDFFHPRTGRWSTPTGEAWQPAVAVEAVLIAHELTGDGGYLDVVHRSFRRHRGRRSAFVDDDGWYLNAWLGAFALCGDREYFDEGQSLFLELTTAWDQTCGGGLWWRKDRSYKNAITNELFLLAAARLHNQTGDQRYLDWAMRAWHWFDGSGLINAAHLVNDGLDASCANNGGQTWTYNQGVILGALVELWRGTGAVDLLRRAGQIADATIRSLACPGDVLREPGEPDVGNKDSYAFKGIFAQGLTRLAMVDPPNGPAYRAFLRANAESVWSTCRDERGGVGRCWVGPVGVVDAATQASAALLLGGVALLDAGPQ